MCLHHTEKLWYSSKCYLSNSRDVWGVCGSSCAMAKIVLHAELRIQPTRLGVHIKFLLKSVLPSLFLLMLIYTTYISVVFFRHFSIKQLSLAAIRNIVVDGLCRTMGVFHTKLPTSRWTCATVSSISSFSFKWKTFSIMHRCGRSSGRRFALFLLFHLLIANDYKRSQAELAR